MFSAELPSFVSTEFTPSTFGRGTQRHKSGDHVVYEVHADRRRAGTSLRSRIYHVAGRDQNPYTTLVLTPGEEYQTIEMVRAGEGIVREIGVNGTHIKMEARDAETNEMLDKAMLGFQGSRFEKEKAQQLSLLDIPADEESPPPSDPGLEHVLGSVMILPDAFATEQIMLLRKVGEVIRSPQHHLPADLVVSLTEMFPPASSPETITAS